MRTEISRASSRPTFSISVRELVSFILRKGNIAGNPSSYSSDRLVEGTEIHKKFYEDAKSKNDEFISEVRLASDIALRDFDISVSGNADGIALEGDSYRVYEIKSVKKAPDKEIAPNPLHLAQAKCYAHMLAVKKKLDHVTVSLVYVPTNDDDPVYYDREYSANELGGFFSELISSLLPFAQFALNRYVESREKLRKVSFPFDVMREGQREMIRTVYGAGKRSYNSYISAPTGIGKTISALFPAVKLLANDVIDRIFYITPRAGIKNQALETVSVIQKNEPFLRTISIASKYHLCRFDECIASADTFGSAVTEESGPFACEKACGHYSRINDALIELLSSVRNIGEHDIVRISEKYKVCPFELTLDAALFCDIIICDFNYIFDPFVMLKRFDQRSKSLLLVDEAHELPERVRENYSAEIVPADISYFVGNAKKNSKKLYSAALNVKKDLKRIKDASDESGNYIFFMQDDILEADMYELRDSLRDYMTGSVYVTEDAETDPLDPDKVRDMYFKSSRYLLASERCSKSKKREYAFICTPTGGVKLYLVDPSDTISAISSGFRSASFFSATLLPESYFMTMLGGSSHDVFLELPSPFPQENRLILSADISVKFSDRERTANALCRLMHTAFNVKKGNYIAFLPSFEYTELIYKTYTSMYPDHRTVMQKRNMKIADKDAFLGLFRQVSLDDSSLVGFAVLGGSFAEGIDLVGNTLLGTVIAGVGLAPPNPESEAQSMLFTDLGYDGKELSYDMPGLARVFQAAGRVIRSEFDKGFIILADTRYSDERLCERLVSDWTVHHIEDSAALKRKLTEFWSET